MSSVIRQKCPGGRGYGNSSYFRATTGRRGGYAGRFRWPTSAGGPPPSVESSGLLQVGPVAYVDPGVLAGSGGFHTQPGMGNASFGSLLTGYQQGIGRQETGVRRERANVIGDCNCFGCGRKGHYIKDCKQPWRLGGGGPGTSGAAGDGGQRSGP